MPQLTMPTWIQALLTSRRNIGPPESPWQVSTPPWVKPAQISSLGIRSGYDCRQLESLTNGTVAFIRNRCCGPPSRVAPHPATVNVPVLYCVVPAVFRVLSEVTGL